MDVEWVKANRTTIDVCWKAWITFQRVNWKLGIAEEIYKNCLLGSWRRKIDNDDARQETEKGFFERAGEDEGKLDLVACEGGNENRKKNVCEIEKRTRKKEEERKEKMILD